ncbi:MAG: amidase [Planctomycetota bacterium]|nr:amidase [Planctomycetota bacterium]
MNPAIEMTRLPIDPIHSVVTRRRLFQKTAFATTTLALQTIPVVHSASNTSTIPFDEYSQFDAVGLAKLIRRRKVTPLELLQTALAQAASINPALNAIAATMAKQAKQTISQGLPDGYLRGVPFLVKDLSFSMKGIESSMGSKLFQGRKSTADSTAITRYRRAGLVLFARTQVPELGLLPTTESTFAGITRNPYDLNRTAGGSSGGSACAVAAGIAPIASASDGGGSIRIPASCCGLFGLKPTRARTPIGPEAFESWGGLAVLHAITRSVRDSAALLDILSGSAVGDSYHAPYQRGRFQREVPRRPRRLRIALVQTMPPAANPDPECQQALQDAGKLCESLGHEVDDMTAAFGSQFDFEKLRNAHGSTVIVAVRQRVITRLEELKRDLRDDDLEAVTRFYFEVAKNYTATQLNNARTAFHQAARQMAQFQLTYDLILTPTLATPPVKHGQITMTGSPQSVVRGLLDFCPCTAMANWTGQPAMSVPLYQTKDHLPIGIQFMGRFGDEATLFQLAGQLEQAKPWSQRRPNI